MTIRISHVVMAVLTFLAEVVACAECKSLTVEDKEALVVYVGERFHSKRVIFPSGGIVLGARRWWDGRSWVVGPAGKEAPFCC